jgi:MFS family permease
VLLGTVLVLGTVQTAISQFSSLAIEEFHLESAALVRIVLIVQFVALPGALLVGWLSTRWSRRGALALCLAGWIFVLVAAWFVQTTAQLTWLAVLLALVLGGVQSVLRANVAVLAPQGRFGATFGLMQVGTKLAGFFASLVFGGIYAATGHPRTGSGRRQSHAFAAASRMRNTFIAAGPHTPAELIASVDQGLYCKSMGGGSVGPTGQFNFAVEEAYLIEDGQLTKPVKGATLIGEAKEVMPRISMCANDLELAAGFCGSVSGSINVTVGQPHIKVDTITVGGR